MRSIDGASDYKGDMYSVQVRLDFLFTYTKMSIDRSFISD